MATKGLQNYNAMVDQMAANYPPPPNIPESAFQQQKKLSISDAQMDKMMPKKAPKKAAKKAAKKKKASGPRKPREKKATTVETLRQSIRNHNRKHCPTQAALRKKSLTELKTMATGRGLKVKSTRKR